MRTPLQVLQIPTRVFKKNENLIHFITDHLPVLKERSILAITSKIVSLSEGRTYPKSSITKSELISREADFVLGEGGYGCHLTIKEGLLIPSAGIDESNSETGEYILYPSQPFVSARRIHEALVQHYGLQELGILITDSHTLPLRQGVTGITLSYWGFKGVRSRVGELDLFGRPLQMTQMNLVDGLSASAVLMMGEGNESTPLAVIQDAPVLYCFNTDPRELHIAPELDLYAPLYTPWQTPRAM